MVVVVPLPPVPINLPSTNIGIPTRISVLSVLIIVVTGANDLLGA